MVLNDLSKLFFEINLKYSFVVSRAYLITVEVCCVSKFYVDSVVSEMMRVGVYF